MYVIEKSWPAKKKSGPQTPRQVSAYDCIPISSTHSR